MVTFVGTQEDFGEALQELVELEYDAVEAYETAISRVEEEEYRDELASFRDDHLQHITEISRLLKAQGLQAPEGPGMGKQWLTKGKVVLANLLGDGAILGAMRSNEIDTNTAYERLKIHEGIWEEAREVIAQGLKDEQRHKKWLEEVLDAE